MSNDTNLQPLTQEPATANNQQEFRQVCNIIELHRTRALYAVNQEHLLACWEVGAYVYSRLQCGTWGDKIIRALADYIKRNLPNLKGYGKSNLYNMVKFYQAYTHPEFLQLIASHPTLQQLPAVDVIPQIVQPAVGQITSNPIVQPMVGQMSEAESSSMPTLLQLVTYTHHTIILNNCHTPHEQLFYILYANQGFKPLRIQSAPS